MNRVNEVLNKALSVLDNQVVSSVLGLFLVLYASLAAPKLPRSIANLFDNTGFKVLILFLIAYISSKNKSVALIAAVGIVVSLQTLNRHKVNDKIVSIMEDELDESEIQPIQIPEISMDEDEHATITEEQGMTEEIRGYTEDEENIAEVLGEESSQIVGANPNTWGPAPHGEMSYHPVPSGHDINLPAPEEIIEEESRRLPMEAQYHPEHVMEAQHHPEHIMETQHHPEHVMETQHHPEHVMEAQHHPEHVMESIHQNKPKRVPAMNSSCMQFPDISGFGGNEFAEI